MKRNTDVRRILGLSFLLISLPVCQMEGQTLQGRRVPVAVQSPVGSSGKSAPGKPSAGQDSPTLRLEEVLDLAREGSPRLRAALERVEVARAREPGAGLLPDPFLQVGVMNLAIPEFSASMPASMAPAFQATQRIPLAGKLSLREEMARQATKIDRALAEETWWEVRTETASVFYRIYEVDRRLEVMGETLGLLRDFESIARSMYSSGTGRQTDVLRAHVEVSRMEAEIETLTARRVGATSRLNAILNRPSMTPIPAPVLDPLPATLPGHAILRDWAFASRPLLRGMREEVELAGTRKTLAEKEIWPDLTLGLQYGLGRMSGDVKGMGGASVGFSLPIYAGKRQMKARDEAAAAESMTRARYDEVQALVDARITEVLADLKQTRTLIRLYREDILPQARATVESSLASYRVGAVDFMTLLDAQMAVNRFEGEYFGLLAQYGAGITRLETAIGRDLPVTGELLLEDS